MSASPDPAQWATLYALRGNGGSMTRVKHRQPMTGERTRITVSLPTSYVATLRKEARRRAVSMAVVLAERLQVDPPPRTPDTLLAEGPPDAAPLSEPSYTGADDVSPQDGDMACSHPPDQRIWRSMKTWCGACGEQV